MNKSFFLVIVFIALVFNCYGQGNYKVGQQTLLLEDTNRQRKLPTEIWYPASIETENNVSPRNLKTMRDSAIVRKRLPLVLLSHGFGGDRMSLEWIAAALAQKGFIVAAVSHWGNTYENLIPQRSLEFPERPKDISFVVSKLLENPAFKNSIDKKRIGALGYSIGGYTVLALAGAAMDYDAIIDFSKTEQGIKEFSIPEMPNTIETANSAPLRNYYKQNPTMVKDKRIKAVFAISPAIGGAFRDAKQMSRINIPVFIIGAEGDQITPPATNSAHYHKLIKNSDFYLFKGKAGHYVFIAEGNAELAKQRPVYFADDPSVSRREIHEKTLDLAIKYFGKKLK